jgi:hypothetical protein
VSRSNTYVGMPSYKSFRLTLQTASDDCLPAIGHACGHNVIAAMAAGAGIALAKVADDAGLTVAVLGTGRPRKSAMRAARPCYSSAGVYLRELHGAGPITPVANQAIFNGSVAMAWRAIDATSDAKLRAWLMSAPRP